MSHFDQKIDIHNRRRIRLLAIVFCVICMGAVLVRLAYMQIINREFYEQKALVNQTRDITIYSTRGTIYDTNGKPLAISASTEMLIVNPKQLKPEKVSALSKAEKSMQLQKYGLPEETKNANIPLTEGEMAEFLERRVEIICTKLAELLELEEDGVRAKLTKNSGYQVLCRGLEKEQADEIRSFLKENKLTGILYFEPDSTRYYPYGSFLSSVLGCVGSDEQGLSGLESQYDDILTGTPGRAVTLTDRKGNALSEDYELYYPAEEGQSLKLTVDEVLQHYLEKELEIAYHDNAVQGSAIGIVMDVNDGGILAMGSYPDFDPNEAFTITDPVKLAALEAMPEGEEKDKAHSDAIYEMWENKGIHFIYYPGSTFKIITTASALEEGVVNENSSFFCPGFKMVDGWNRPIHCWKTAGHGTENLREALMNSCNPALMTIGLSLGKERFTEYATAFGFRDQTGIDLPGEANGIFNLKSNVDLAVYSFGQNFAMTPLQLITAVSAVANGGTLLQPHIVKEILNADGTVAQSFGRTEVRQVISAENSALMCDMLEDVVQKGTGKNAYIAGYRLAGKTGTTEKIDKMADGKDYYVTSFVAFAPADDPQIAVLILLDEPTALPISGGLNTAPVVRRFLEEALPYLGIDPIYTEEEQAARNVSVPDLTGMTLTEAEAALKKAGLTCQSVGSEPTVTAQVPAAGAIVSGNTKAIVYLGGNKPEKEISVPTLNGMTLSAAKKALSELGLYIRVSGGVSEGSQQVTKQDTPAKTTVSFGSVITVETTDMAQRAE